MAERMATADFAGPRRRYNWPDWTDGTIWKLRRGEDYDGEGYTRHNRKTGKDEDINPTDEMRNRLYNYARRKQLEVRTMKGVDEDGVEILTFQFYGHRNGNL